MSNLRLIGIVAAILAFLYFALVRWRVSQPRKVVYNSRMARILKFVTRGMVCTTFWHTAYLDYPEGTPGETLTTDGHVHEFTHMTQWDRYPYTFWIRYLWQLWRHGYCANPYEVAARAAAGETEC